MARRGQHEIVAGDFAFQVDAAGDPTHHRVQREQGFQDALHGQRIVVLAGQVSGFMQADLVEGAFIQLVEKAGWNQDGGTNGPTAAGMATSVEQAMRTLRRVEPHSASQCAARTRRAAGG